MITLLLLEHSGKKPGKTSEKDVNKVKGDTVASSKDPIAKGSKKLMDVDKNKTEDTANVEQRVKSLSLYLSLYVCVCAVSMLN